MTNRDGADASLTVGTAGHIDHGKTALVRALTGKDTDRLEEERRRGMSIELGYAELDLGGRRLSLVDVPGHERFVRTMIAGASGIDLFLLVVAADDGVMPQTREHAEVLRALGVEDGLVALTKLDLVEPERLVEVEREVAVLAPGAEIVRASSRTGEGIEALRSSLGQLAERVDSRRAAHGGRDEAREAVLHVDRVFTVAGHGTVVTGTLWTGTVRRGDRVLILPSGKEARVRSIESHDRSHELVGPRRRVALNLAGLGRDEVRRGDVVTALGSDLQPTYRLDGDLTGKATASPDAEPTDRAPALPDPPRATHRPDIEPTGRATAVPGADVLTHQPDIEPTDRATASPDAEPDLEPTDRPPALPDPPRATHRPDIEPTGGAVVTGAHHPIDRHNAELAAGAAKVLGERRVQVHHGTRESAARVVDLGDGAVQLRLEQPLLARLGDHVVIRRIAPPDTLGGAIVIDPSPRRHSDRSEISAEDFGSQATKNRDAPEPAVPPEPSELARRVLAELEGDEDRPRTPAKLSEDIGLERRKVERAVGELVDAGAAVRFKVDVVYPTATAHRLATAATALATADGSTSIGEVRDALGLSRKYAQALLEHLDGERVLRRDGDRHLPRGVGK